MTKKKYNIIYVVVIMVVLYLVLKSNTTFLGATSGGLSDVQRDLPRTTVYNNQPFDVNLVVDITGGETFYLLKEYYDYPTLDVVDNGGGDDGTESGAIFWTPMSGATSTTHTYQLQTDTPGTYTFSGLYGFEGGTSGLPGCTSEGCPITGDTSITVVDCSPTTETCNGQDDDCDYTTDEDVTRHCYTGTSGTEGVGECTGGTETCIVGGSGSWGNCVGQVVDVPETINSLTCNNGLDDDCDGEVDENMNTAADINPCDNVVSMDETLTYLARWKNSEVTMDSTLNVLSAWKGG